MKQAVKHLFMQTIPAHYLLSQFIASLQATEVYLQHIMQKQLMG